MRRFDLGRVFAFVLLTVCAFTVFSPPVLAAAGGHEEHAGAGQEEPKEGLGFTGFKYYDLGIYTLIVFTLLIFILARFAWPNIKQGLEKREAMIRNAHEEAKQDRINAEARLSEARRQLDEAALQAKAILDEARKAADALKASEREAGVKEAEAKKLQAEREILAEREAMIRELYERSVQLAALISEKALRREVSVADHSRLLDESLAELQAATKA